MGGLAIYDRREREREREKGVTELSIYILCIYKVLNPKIKKIDILFTSLQVFL